MPDAPNDPAGRDAPDPKSRFLDSLLGQDPPLSSDLYEEYRTMLDKKLDDARRGERRGRRATIAVWVASLSMLAVGFAGSRIDDPRWVGEAFGAVAFLGGVCFYWGIVRIGIYLAYERRGVDAARTEVRDALILELTRKVDALARRIDGTGGTAGSG